MKIKNSRLYKLLAYLTNNSGRLEDEVVFDIVGFLVGLIALIFGIVILLIKKQPEWIAFLVLEAVWAFDTLRHNRN